MRPLMRLICPFLPKPKTNNNTVKTDMTGISRVNTSCSIGIGAIAPASPTTASVLNRLEPIILPTAKSTSFLRAAAIDEASSGSDVPTATIVKPTTNSLTPK